MVQMIESCIPAYALHPLTYVSSENDSLKLQLHITSSNNDLINSENNDFYLSYTKES